MAFSLSIPRQYEEALTKVGRLSEESTQELLAALRKTPNTISPSSLSSAVAAQVDTIAASDVEEIVPALLSLYSLRAHSEAAISDIVGGVVQAMGEGGLEGLGPPPEERTRFEDRLAELLSVSQLNETARAGRLLLENEHSFQETRVVTDIRPVFDLENPEAPPKGALIVHMLKIVYRTDNNTTKDFFVALDTKDVRVLLEQLERANAKAESLKPVLKAAGMDYIDVK